MASNANTDQAARLAQDYGDNAGNAQQLIDANNARYTREMREAMLLPVNEEATAALDLKKVAAAFDVDEVKPGDAKVRGSYVVAQWLHNGVFVKSALDADAVGKGKPVKLKVADAEDAARARFAAQADAAESVQDAQSKADKLIADAEAKARKLIADAVQDATAAVKKITKQAEQDAEKASSAND